MAKMAIHAHKLVAETAKAMAHELYDTLMQDDLLFTTWKKQNPGLGPKGLENAFVKRNVDKCVEVARATLAVMLRNPATDEAVKETIYAALCLDQQLVRGRKNPMQVLN